MKKIFLTILFLLVACNIGWAATTFNDTTADHKWSMAGTNTAAKYRSSRGYDIGAYQGANGSAITNTGAVFFGVSF